MNSRFMRGAISSALLSTLFLVVYGACNQLTALRTDVGTIAFAWERFIPFVPLMIVPYMSIDLFFVAAPFLCSSDAERRLLQSRITLAVLVAGACFLLFPLKFAFERPVATGLLGTLFDWFRSMDPPFNLAPSLHIALRTVLAAFYHRHTRGVLRTAMHVWFSLIGFSTLLVWQHHLMDVVTGFILGSWCVFAFPEAPAAREVLPNRRVALYYAIGSMLAIFLAWLLRPWGVLLLWPAFALGLAAAAYVSCGPSIFQKTAGCLPLSTRIILGPILLGQRLSLRYYARQGQPWDKVLPNVWIGRVLNDAEALQAQALGVTAVLDLTGEFSEAHPFLALRYRNIAVMDLTAPTPAQLDEISSFIATESARGIVYVHCKIGYSRSAAAVGAFLLSNGRVDSAAAAIQQLRVARPAIVVRAEAVSALNAYARRLSVSRPAVGLASGLSSVT